MSAPTDDHGRPLTMWGMLALVHLLQCDAIGHKCSAEDCTGLATWSVPWPGRDASPQCDHHFERTQQIAGVFAIRGLIIAGARPLRPMRREPDPAAERVAQMELT